MKIFDIIKYEGSNDVFVWKFPGEDFNTLSQLIVSESQEAIFFKDGKALDLLHTTYAEYSSCKKIGKFAI